jgi:hypothetical protein
LKKLSAGFISYDCVNADFITVRFSDGEQQVGNDIKVLIDSSVAFTHTEFNRITVTCPRIIAGSSNQSDDFCPDACEGEICIKTRFPVDLDKKNHTEH